MTDFLQYNKALQLANKGLFEQALAAVNTAIELNPKPEYILLKGKVLALDKKYTEAIEIFTKILNDDKFMAEAEKAIKLCRKLSNPLGKITTTIARTKGIGSARNILLIILLTLFVVLYLNEKRHNKVQENLISIYQKTEDISTEVDGLNQNLKSEEVLKVHHLIEANVALTESFEIKMKALSIDMQKKQARMSQELRDSRLSLDSLHRRIETLVVASDTVSLE